jgi:hypothetical protein
MLLRRAHLYLPFTKACVEALLGLSGWSPQHFSRAQVELRTVPGTRNHVALAFAFVERPSSVSACVGYGAHLPVHRAAYQHITPSTYTARIAPASSSPSSRTAVNPPITLPSSSIISGRRGMGTISSLPYRMYSSTILEKACFLRRHLLLVCRRRHRCYEGAFSDRCPTRGRRFSTSGMALGELLLDTPRRPEDHIGHDVDLRDRYRVHGTRDLDDISVAR